MLTQGQANVFSKKDDPCGLTLEERRAESIPSQKMDEVMNDLSGSYSDYSFLFICFLMRLFELHSMVFLCFIDILTFTKVMEVILFFINTDLCLQPTSPQGYNPFT